MRGPARVTDDVGPRERARRGRAGSELDEPPAHRVTVRPEEDSIPHHAAGAVPATEEHLVACWVLRGGTRRLAQVAATAVRLDRQRRERHGGRALLRPGLPAQVPEPQPEARA